MRTNVVDERDNLQTELKFFFRDKNVKYKTGY